jgi:hypothetical protein
MTPALAAQHLAVATFGDLPAYLMLRSEHGDGGVPASAANPPTLHPFTRELGEALASEHTPGETMATFIRTLAARQQRTYAPAVNAWIEATGAAAAPPPSARFRVAPWLDTDRGPIPALALLYDGVAELSAPPIVAYVEAGMAYATSPSSVSLVAAEDDHLPPSSHTGAQRAAPTSDRWPRSITFQRSAVRGTWSAVAFTAPMLPSD